MKFVIAKEKWLLVLPLLAMVFGCAKSVDEDADGVERQLLEAYIYQNYGSRQLQPTASGLYFIEEQAGTGATPAEGDFVFVNYTMRDTEGNISVSGTAPLTNSDSLARQLGVFSHSTYYGPKIYSVDKATLYAGLVEGLAMMKVGGKARIVVPSWLSEVGSLGRQLTGITLFDIELLQVVNSIDQFETDTLQAFSNRHYQGMDSLRAGWYYQEITPGDAADSVAAIGDTLKVRYVGYLLDGFVFDTNIADSAAYYRIYSSAKAYDVLSVVYAKSNDADTGDSSSEGKMDVVDGFKYALQRMRPGEEGVTFFSSDYGYAAQGSGQIPPYSPLRFHIKLERIGRKK